MGRAILAVIAGCVLAVLIVVGMDALSAFVYPPPAGLDPRDPAAMRTIIVQMPTGAFIVVVAGWILAAGFGALVATRYGGGRIWAGAIVGAVVLIATGANLFTIAHPFWVVVTSVIGIPLATWGGIRAARTPLVTATTKDAATYELEKR